MNWQMPGAIGETLGALGVIPLATQELPGRRSAL